MVGKKNEPFELPMIRYHYLQYANHGRNYKYNFYHCNYNVTIEKRKHAKLNCNHENSITLCMQQTIHC